MSLVSFGSCLVLLGARALSADAQICGDPVTSIETLNDAIDEFNGSSTCTVIDIRASFTIAATIEAIAANPDAPTGVPKDLTILGNNNVLTGADDRAGFIIVLDDNDDVGSDPQDVTIDGLGLTNFGGTGAVTVLSGGLSVRHSRFVDNSFVLPLTKGEVGTSDSEASAGAINAYGDLMIIESEFIGNSGDLGGAVHSASDTIVAVSATTFAGNHATTAGGALYISGSLSMRNSTVFNNVSTLAGGLNVVGDVSLDFCTIVENVSVYDNGAVTADGDVTLTNTILYGNLSNSAGGTPAVVDVVSPGDVDISSSLLTSDTSVMVLDPGTLTASSTIYGDPELESLRDYGGFELPGGSTITTMMPRRRSPVIDAIPPAEVDSNRNEFDQRGVGFPRVIGDFPDIGAVEYRRTSPPPTWEPPIIEESELPDTH